MSETKKRLVATVKRSKNAIGAWALRRELLATVVFVTLLGLAVGAVASVLNFFLAA